MTNKKIKVPCYTMEPIQFKLYYFCEEFSGFSSGVSKKLVGCQDMSPELIRLEKNGEIIFSNSVAVCPVCGSHHNVKDGKMERELIFMNLGNQTCKVQRYKCTRCGNVFSADLSSIVEVNRNITKPVIDFIFKSYSIGGDSIRKIMHRLKEIHNVDISYQSVENILLGFEYDFDNGFYSFSGYYLFDALWVKINSTWNYLLALFDLHSNTIVSYDLASSESEKSILQVFKRIYLQSRS